MQRRIKLIWDFRGPEAREIAAHHVVHLKEFAEKEKLPLYDAAAEPVSDLYCMASITVDEQDMITFRDALRPHRGEVAK